MLKQYESTPPGTENWSASQLRACVRSMPSVPFHLAMLEAEAKLFIVCTVLYCTVQHLGQPACVYSVQATGTAGEAWIENGASRFPDIARIRRLAVRVLRSVAYCTERPVQVPSSR